MLVTENILTLSMAIVERKVRRRFMATRSNKVIVVAAAVLIMITGVIVAIALAVKSKAGQDLHPAQAELTEISLGGVDLESVKLILSTYEIGEDRIAVVPFANELSSYAGKTSTAPTDPETIAMVRELVFGK